MYKKIAIVLIVVCLILSGCSNTPYTKDNNSLNQPEVEEPIAPPNNQLPEVDLPNSPDSSLPNVELPTLPPDNQLPNVNIPPIPQSIRGTWVSTVWNIDYPYSSTTDSIKLSTQIDNIVSNAIQHSLNAIFFQVRPCSDALYPSVIYPWSSYLTGQLGLAPNDNFDPLEYIIQQCHNNNIALHAWVNPYRLSTNQALSTQHPISQYPHIIMNVDNKLYLNPAHSDSQDFILAGVKELCNNYAIDGIHFDDYFYPEGITSQDDAEYIQYGQEYHNKDDFRRACVNNLVYKTNNLIKNINPNIKFGISPSGIWSNQEHNPLGSNTRGFESYYQIYCDSRTWVLNGWIDYVAPQLYWYIGQQWSDYAILLDWWHDVCKDTNVQLYIGIAGYKIGTDTNWNNPQQIVNQLQLADDLANGWIIFSYSDLDKLAH
ncbi:MAG: family 10 glycosylhydrolase [Clostridiales bacterium]|jgi:uncharacterized lipoprotein YddW (UPF0748 family)|nr:family 10 glycosylhydrolase [Clostridiales bacterium]